MTSGVRKLVVVLCAGAVFLVGCSSDSDTRNPKVTTTTSPEGASPLSMQQVESYLVDQGEPTADSVVSAHCGAEDAPVRPGVMKCTAKMGDGSTTTLKVTIGKDYSILMEPQG